MQSINQWSSTLAIMKREGGLIWAGHGNFFFFIFLERVAAPSVQWLTYGPFRGPCLYPLSPHYNSGSYSLSPFYSRTPYWAWTISFTPLSLCFFLFHSLFSVSLPFLLSFCFSPSHSFIIDQFIFLFLLSPFLLFPVISYRFIFCPSSATQTLLLLSLFTSV